MPENIVDILNKITEKKGGAYAQILVDGINIGMVLGSIGKSAEVTSNPG